LAEFARFAEELSHEGRGKAARSMKPFLQDVPFKGSRRVYLVIKLVVLVLAVLLALHFVFGVV
jgi:hypothetical protein